jgi:hypothetical protein
MARGKEELFFDCHGGVSVDDIRDCREPPAVEYKPPTYAKWRALLGVLFMPKWSGAAKAVMGCLISHANPTTGRCDPGHARIAKMLELPTRTVERAMRFLKTTPTFGGNAGAIAPTHIILIGRRWLMRF